MITKTEVGEGVRFLKHQRAHQEPRRSAAGQVNEAGWWWLGPRSGVDQNEIVILVGRSRTGIDHDEVFLVVSVVEKGTQNDEVVLVAGTQLQVARREGDRCRGSVYGRGGIVVQVVAGDAVYGGAGIIRAGAPHIAHHTAGFDDLDSDLVHSSKDARDRLAGEYLVYAVADACECRLETPLLRSSGAGFGDGCGLVTWLVGS